MASTNKTANLSLNQWVPTDPVLMEDMNEDNRKLDAALGKTASYTKLFDITLQTAAKNITLDCSKLDLSQYQELEFYLTLVGGSTTKEMRINDIASNYTSYNYNGTSLCSGFSIDSGKHTMDLTANSYYLYTPPSKNNFGLYRSSSMGTIQSFSFVKLGESYNEYLVGTRITVLGVKKC